MRLFFLFFSIPFYIYSSSFILEGDPSSVHFYEEEQTLREVVIDQGQVVSDITYTKKEPSTSHAITRVLHTIWEKETSVLESKVEEIIYFLEQVIGEGDHLFLWGFEPQTLLTGTVGKGEISPNLRMTAINGILNRSEEWTLHVEDFSRTHGCCNVHYVYSASGGWTKDMFRGICAKLGIISKPAELLASMWRSLLEEMEHQGTIVHYCHSLGSAETYLAGLLLSAQERSQIRVTSFGTPVLFPKDFFGSVDHYIALRDTIPLFDPLRYLHSLAISQDHIHYVGGFQGLPLLDHHIYIGTYVKEIERLGQEFVEQYGAVSREDIEPSCDLSQQVDDEK